VIERLPEIRGEPAPALGERQQMARVDGAERVAPVTSPIGMGNPVM